MFREFCFDVLVIKSIKILGADGDLGVGGKGDG